MTTCDADSDATFIADARKAAYRSLQEDTGDAPHADWLLARLAIGLLAEHLDEVTYLMPPDDVAERLNERLAAAGSRWRLVESAAGSEGDTAEAAA